MSTGSVLIGIALALVVGVYLARPFRLARHVDLDRAIEGWVAQVRADQEEERDQAGEERCERSD